DGPIRSVEDLPGHVIAIPSRFSDERLIVFKALAAHRIPATSVRMVEMAPPDVAGALAAGAIDAFSMGEPYPSQAELGGFGRVLFQAREYWPDYMSCVVVARQDGIDRRPPPEDRVRRVRGRPVRGGRGRLDRLEVRAREREVGVADPQDFAGSCRRFNSVMSRLTKIAASGRPYSSPSETTTVSATPLE